MTSPRRVAAAYLRKTAASTLPPALRKQVNTELVAKGFGGKKRFLRVGQIVSELFDSLKKYGLTLSSPLSPRDFMREQGTLRVDIEFINEADPFSPIPVSNSLLFIQYTQMASEGDSYEVIAYLS